MKRISPRQSVRGRLLLLAIGVELVMLTLLVANSHRLLNNAMTDQARWQVQQMMPVLSAALKAPLAQRDYATMQAIVDESRATEGIDYVVVADREGRMVALSGWNRDQKLPQESKPLSLVKFSTTDRYDGVMPINQSGQHLGSLHMGLNLSRVISARHTLLTQGVVIATVELVLSFVILALIGLWLTRHLTALATASLQVASGNLSPAPLHEGKDDMGQLGAAFNLMSRAISERVSELTAAKEAAEASERAKSKSEMRLRAITDSANDAILMMDAAGAVSYWNPAACRIFGYCDDDVMGKDLHELLAPKRYHYAFRSSFAKFRENGMGNAMGRTIEVFARRKDGREIPVSLSLSAVVLDHEWHSVGILHDISAQKQAEQELREAKEKAEASEHEKSESEERLKLVLDGSNDGFWDWDVPSGRIAINRRWAEILGYSLDDFPDPTVKDWEDKVDPEHKEHAFQAVSRCLEGETPNFEVEYRMRTKSGGLVWILDRGKVVERGADGKPVRCAGTHTNITVRKETEALLHQNALRLEQEVAERQLTQELLAAKQDQLEMLNLSLRQRVDEAVTELRQKDQVLISQGRQAAMGEMIGNIAHQWRQPLNALAMVVSNLQFAQRDGTLTPDYLDTEAATAQRLIQKMSTTINDFRDFFSPDKEKVPFSALQQIEQAVQLVEAAFKNSNISIILDAGNDCTLYGLPNEYSQVLLNLLTNARESIAGAGVRHGGITISIEEQGGMGVVRVRDNGSGIPAEVQDKIFEPYFSTKSMGTGIGLYMSKMIIEKNMSGSLTAGNVEGGAEFAIKTPLAERKP
ncbi:PAS domain S-box protein [Geomonas agri]|uniref:PAS domain S-box protein n=1 Tax=Geomonas agri TaxID=2873702 RepID=UPI001CD3942C|nr:PAS domain S-box protein [Geomonas agri]